MNTIVRTFGGAIGAEVAASVLSAHVLAGGEPTKAGYTITFSICASVLFVGVLASLAVPGRGRRQAHRAREPRGGDGLKEGCMSRSGTVATLGSFICIGKDEVIDNVPTGRRRRKLVRTSWHRDWSRNFAKRRSASSCRWTHDAIPRRPRHVHAG